MRNLRSGAPGAVIVGLILGLFGCMDEPSVVIKEDLSKVRLRSVTVNAANCRLRQTDEKLQKCEDISNYDLLRVAELRGINGAPVRAVATDDDTLTAANYGNVSAYWSRIPFGYGCKATLQGIFPSPARVAACADKAGCDSKPDAEAKTCVAACVTQHSDPDKIENFDLTELNRLIGAVRNAHTVPIWTAGYDIGDGLGGCTYGLASKQGKGAVPYAIGGKEVAEQLGKGIDNPAKWAKAVRKITNWYNRALVKQQSTAAACTATPTAANPRPWDCSPSLFNIEFGRDPNGAGGFNDSTKKKWLEAFDAFATEMRDEFPWPANGVHLLAPSVVVDESILLQGAKSWLFDFVDHVVANKLPLTYLSFEVVASDPIKARDIVRKIKDYTVSKKMLNENGQPIELFVTDLRLVPPKDMPASLLPTGDKSVQDKSRMARYSAYEGTFLAATKALWQGMVYGATVGTVVRFPTVDPSQTPDDIAKSATESNLVWYPSDKLPPSGTLKPAAWHSFWFNEGFLGGGAGKYGWCKPGTGSQLACSSTEECQKKNKAEICSSGKCVNDCSDIAAEKRRKAILQVGHGPDAMGLSGSQNSNENDHLIVLATRETCVDQEGSLLDCVIETDAAGNLKPSFPAVTEGRKRVIRVLVADANIDKDGADGKETLEHQLRLQVTGLPKDLAVKSVGFRWARMNGNRTTWCNPQPPYNCSFVFPEQGVIDVTDGTFSITKPIAVPSLHYFEFMY